MSRLADIKRFYDLLARLEDRLGGKRTLAEFRQFRDCPPRGVYFFFEPGENRRDSGNGPRVVRVGTHALTAGSKSTLRQRLGQHRGSASGGGNHRTSIFRLLVGEALLARGDLGNCSSWGVKGEARLAADHLQMDRAALKVAELPIERQVTAYLGTLPFLWIDIADEPGPDSQRGFIERNAIALLSNHGRAPLDAASVDWLGRKSGRELVRASHLWNQRHVEETHDPAFLDVLDALTT